MQMTRRELLCAAAGIMITLLVGVPVVAAASPGAIPGSGPGEPAAPGAEQALQVSRGESCRDMLPADTPSYVVCRWMAPPQDAAEVAAFWGADDAANLQSAQPLPAQYVRCNEKTDLSKSPACKGGQTFCKQRPDGWYTCKNLTTDRTTYERVNDGTRVVRTSPPTVGPSSASSAATSAAPTVLTPTAAVPTTAGPPADYATQPPDGNPATSTPSAPQPEATPTPPPIDSTAMPDPSTPTAGPDAMPLTAAIKAATKAHLRIWIEADLVDDYQAGDAQFHTAVQALIAAAEQPAVIGVKFADNLAYSGFSSAGDVTDFLTRATGALRPALPGKRLAIGVVVPELGCGPSQPCIRAMRAKAPLATKQRVDTYLKAADVDRVEIASGLFGRALSHYQVPHPRTRQPTAITPALASRAQWLAIRALGWDTLAQIGSREYGLAHRSGSPGWDTATATAQIDARVGSVVGLGVPTVTLWGHQATDAGHTYQLLNPGLTPNATWMTLRGLRPRLAVVFDPTAVEVGITSDIAALAKGVAEIFILT
ncbi:hypothetical protein AB0L44_14820 [Nonomuraea wenchangensis]|uniref:hypothetical protein n=1 Tax=Nonomuraea wenchangensis TaxID=568860 RepID=UPI00342A9060